MARIHPEPTPPASFSAPDISICHAGKQAVFEQSNTDKALYFAFYLFPRLQKPYNMSLVRQPLATHQHYHHAPGFVAPVSLADAAADLLQPSQARSSHTPAVSGPTSTQLQQVAQLQQVIQLQQQMMNQHQQQIDQMQMQHLQLTEQILLQQCELAKVQQQADRVCAERQQRAKDILQAM